MYDIYLYLIYIYIYIYNIYIYNKYRYKHMNCSSNMGLRVREKSVFWTSFGCGRFQDNLFSFKQHK